MVTEGRNLPVITNRRFDMTDIKCHDAASQLTQTSAGLPNTYVTLPRAFNDNFLVEGDPVKAMHAKSKVILNSSSPKWEMQTMINCPTELLTDSRRHLIIKVWHRPHAVDAKENECYRLNREPASGIDDYVMGFAAIDLSPLLREGYTNEKNIGPNNEDNEDFFSERAQ